MTMPGSAAASQSGAPDSSHSGPSTRAPRNIPAPPRGGAPAARGAGAPLPPPPRTQGAAGAARVGPGGSAARVGRALPPLGRDPFLPEILREPLQVDVVVGGDDPVIHPWPPWVP